MGLIAMSLSWPLLRTGDGSLPLVAASGAMVLSLWSQYSNYHGDDALHDAWFKSCTHVTKAKVAWSGTVLCCSTHAHRPMINYSAIDRRKVKCLTAIAASTEATWSHDQYGYGNDGLAFDFRYKFHARLVAGPYGSIRALFLLGEITLGRWTPRRH